MPNLVDTEPQSSADAVIILVRYAELGLKAPRARSRFEAALVSNIHSMLSREGIKAEVTRTWGRLFVKPADSADASVALDVLSRTFGVSSASKAKVIHAFLGLDDLSESVSRIIPEGFINAETSFAVKARRAGSGHDFTSMDVAVEVGSRIIKRTGAKVNLSEPDRTVFVEVRDRDAYVYYDSVKGPGGLPYGVEGKVVVLISGGIDSPAACWLAMKRGCRPVFLHAGMNPKSVTKERALSTIKALKRWIPEDFVVVYVTPHASALEEVVKSAETGLTCILCKRLMLRCAELIAVKEGALAIVTGDSIGQVASQTLQNLMVENSVLRSIPVFRPLIGLDKLESEAIAKRIGTFKESTGGVVDKCFAVPTHPATAASLSKVEDEEAFIDSGKLAGALVRDAERMSV